MVVNNLQKQFKLWMQSPVLAVKDVSFEVQPGEIVALLGPNGAGKTTTLQMLLGALTPTSGEITYFGLDFQKNREQVLQYLNFSSTYTNLPWLLSVEEILTYSAYLYSVKNKVERLAEIKQIFNLDEIWKKQFRSLSTGQMNRVNLAKSFINKPKVLLLDEPTASLDPVTAKKVRELIRSEQNRSGLSVVFSSHNMQEVEALADKVVFLTHGRVLTIRKPTQMFGKAKKLILPLQSKQTTELLVLLRQLNLSSTTYSKSKVSVLISNAKLPWLFEQLRKNYIDFKVQEVSHQSLEEFFLMVSKGTYEF